MRFLNFVAIIGFVSFSGCGDKTKKTTTDSPQPDDPEPLVDEEQYLIGNRGQVNLGNTCYFNALMQVLAHADPVKQYLEKTDVGGKAVDSGFKELVMAHWDKDHGGEVYNPKNFLQLCRDNASHCFAPNTQEDAWQAYTALHGILEDDNLKGLFQFNVESLISCPSYNRESRKTEPYFELILQLPETKTNENVTELMRRWGSLEPLQYNCDVTGAPKDPNATRYFTLLTAPDVLVVVLARFKFIDQKSQKIMSPVTYDNELDLGDMMTGHIDPNLVSNGPIKYKLTGVVHHHGTSLGHGHYTADYFNSFYNRWFHADDRQITRRGLPGKKSSSTPYILIYSKVK